MQAVLDTLQNIGIFLAFLAARFAVLLVVLAALTVVFLAGLAVVRLVGLARRRALGLTRVDGLMWRPGVFFSPGHAWLQPREGGALRVGLDDLAQHVLSRISEVILPAPGQLVRAGEPAAIIRAGKRRAAIPAPVTGRVVAVNRRVASNPVRMHNDPYAGGWLYAVQPEDASYTTLPRGDESRAVVLARSGAAVAVLRASARHGGGRRRRTGRARAVAADRVAVGGDDADLPAGVEVAAIVGSPFPAEGARRGCAPPAFEFRANIATAVAHLRVRVARLHAIRGLPVAWRAPAPDHDRTRHSRLEVPWPGRRCSSVSTATRIRRTRSEGASTTSGR